MCVRSAASVRSFAFGDETCVGCDVCSAVFCSLCIERGTGLCKNSVASKFKDGDCSVFYAELVRAHRSHYHEGDLDKAQPISPYRRAVKTSETNRARLLPLLPQGRGGISRPQHLAQRARHDL